MYVECRNIQASAHIKSSVFSSHLQPCLRQGLLLIITHSCEHKSSCHHQHPEDIQRTGILVASPPPPPSYRRNTELQTCYCAWHHLGSGNLHSSPHTDTAIIPATECLSSQKREFLLSVFLKRTFPKDHSKMVAKVSCLKSSPLNANSLYFPIMPQLSIILGWELAIRVSVEVGNFTFYSKDHRKKERRTETDKEIRYRIQGLWLESQNIRIVWRLFEWNLNIID